MDQDLNINVGQIQDALHDATLALGEGINIMLILVEDGVGVRAVRNLDGRSSTEVVPYRAVDNGELTLAVNKAVTFLKA